MTATSTFVYPQKVLIDCIIYPDANGNSLSPAYFKIDVAQYLLNRKIIAIESYSLSDMNYSPNYPGIPVIDSTSFLNAELVLLRENDADVRGGDYYKNIPLGLMRRAITTSLGPGSATQLYRIDPCYISWTDSYINVTTPLTRMSGPISVPLLITFLLPEQDDTPFITVHNMAHASR